MNNALDTFPHVLNAWAPSEIHLDLMAAKALIYDPCDFTCTPPTMEAESTEYGGYVFELNGLFIRFRAAKITPTKVGQFATLWKRVGNSPIKPFDVADPMDFVVVSTRQEDHCGQFVFPKTVLYEQGVLSKNGKGGKRALRVYSPWDKTMSRQAKKTQQWQLDYFLDLSSNKPIDVVRAKQLYGQKTPTC